jgi:pimeloyl-ACP methyl ester carboxylesterase
MRHVLLLLIGGVFACSASESTDPKVATAAGALRGDDPASESASDGAAAPAVEQSPVPLRWRGLRRQTSPARCASRNSSVLGLCDWRRRRLLRDHSASISSCGRVCVRGPRSCRNRSRVSEWQLQRWLRAPGFVHLLRPPIILMTSLPQPHAFSLPSLVHARRSLAHLLVPALLFCCNGSKEEGGSNGTTSAPTSMPSPTSMPPSTSMPSPTSMPVPTQPPSPPPGLMTNVANFGGSNVLADVWVPTDFDALKSTTVIFSHGDKSSPNDNYCYGEILAAPPYNLRVVMPNYGTTEDSENWQSRRDRWTRQKAIYDAAFAQSGNNPNRIVIAGYSFGGYAALLAAGANSELSSSLSVLPTTEPNKQAGNCTAGVCAPLLAKGYVVVSAQPAQGSQNPIANRFWFSDTAFQSFTAATRRYVTFGSVDTSPNDACMTAGSTCRGDAYSIQPLGAVQDIVPDFNHINFACPGSNWSTNAKASKKRALVERIGTWIVSL